MSYHSGDTICAIASAAGGAARGMLRVSGPDALAIVSRCFCADGGTPLARLKRPLAEAGEIQLALGRVLQLPCSAFVWPTSRSYTREPAVELHTIGSPPLLEAALSAVCAAGARLAEPGEFTLRAFLAGRIDLTQAEAVLGVIDAHGDAELSGALAQLAGGLAGPLHRLHDDLLQLLAELEAGLDFVDDDIEFISAEVLADRLNASGRLIDDVAGQMSLRHLVGSDSQIALVGPPNVGKSSLFNALVARFGVPGDGEHRQPAGALVSSQPGTTRDYLTATISLDGVRCELIDTAGIAELPAGRGVTAERAAQAISAERRNRATIRAHCFDASGFAHGAPASITSDYLGSASDADVIVLTKSDLIQLPIQLPESMSSTVVVTSSRTGDGLAELCAAFRRLLAADEPTQRGQAVAATADRCRESIRLAQTAVKKAADLVTATGGDELVAVELRAAIDELGKVVGAVYTDDLLDRIFKTFCIGK